MANPAGSASVPLSIFGSLNLELSPPDLPEGASPANNDVVYLPGSVATRPGLNRVFAMPISSLGPITYEKSFVTPSGIIKNLYLASGVLWVEDVTNSAGTVTQLFQTAGATCASSVTAQGREYIALSDGVHGVDIPLQYDGTNLYRLTQDGPGIPPVVASVALPEVTMAVSGAPSTTGITSITTTDQITVGTYPHTFIVYTTLTLVVADTSSFSIYEPVAISGASGLNVSSTVSAIIDATTLKIGYGLTSFQTETGGTLTGSPATTLVRAGNTVSCTTAAAHNLQAGYQAHIQGAGTSIVGATITSLTINNEENPGLATIVTSAAHGLLPGNAVNIQGVTGTTAGSGIANIAYGGGVVTVSTTATHSLSVGSEVVVAAVTNTAVNGKWIVAQIPSATTFTFLYASAGAPYTAADTGTVEYVWPLASADPAQNYFTVQTAPSATSFTVGLSYTDGAWSGGTVSFGWDGIFYVTAILSSTSFQYQQYGPDASTTTVGKVTPFGQCAPGVHQCRMSFLLADGTITPPSSPVSFVANGGQYVSISQAVTGPDNVVARVFQFTGSGGAYFYYILVPGQANGITVSTSTLLNDNTSNSALLDFSDSTLYRGSGASIPGNDIAAQIVLDSMAGMFTYAGRTFTWGGRNVVRNLTNPGFNGGISNSGFLPAGWTGDNCGTLPVGYKPPGWAWRFNANGTIQQGAYLDGYGAPIFQPNTQYSVRVLLYGYSLAPAVTVTFALSSASTSYVSSVAFAGSQIPVAPTGGYVQGKFSIKTPATIPSDMVLSITASGISAGAEIALQEFGVLFTESPYLDAQAWTSYAENLTGFDANTGVFGSADDTSPIRNFGTIRQTLYMVTGSGLHESEDNGQTEPSSWGVNQVADNCGGFSIASIGRNPQGIGSAGKDWMVWNGPDGAQIFLGQKPFKISQEIQALWDAVPAQYASQCWTKNFESSKRCYFGMPKVDGSMYMAVLDYRNIDSSMIPENPPLRIAFSGKMIVSDLTRKWTLWTIPAWCGELMYRAGVAQPQIVFGCITPVNAANAYTLNATQYNDDDYGTIPASYTTYFFVGHEQEEALGVGSNRHSYSMAQAYITGTGTWTLTPYAAALTNAQRPYGPWPLNNPQNFDVDFGIDITTTRCAFKITAAPAGDGADAYFNIQKLVISMAGDSNARVRGSMQGNS